MISVEEEIEVQSIHTWDEEEIAALYRVGGWWKEEYKTEDLRHLIRDSFAFAVAVDTKSGTAIGMGRVISDGISDGYIQDLVVLPQYRMHGVGARITRFLVNRCQQAGITWIGLIAETGTDSFYNTLGFQVMDEHVPMIYRGEE